MRLFCETVGDRKQVLAERSIRLSMITHPYGNKYSLMMDRYLFYIYASNMLFNVNLRLL